ncbi:MAG: energy-coupling factor transporter transmembrane component T [Actinomycetes bacterium]
MGDPRWLHPGAWWAWALGLAAGASRTTNPLILLLLIGAAAVVVQARRPDAPWARSFAMFVRLGIVVVVVRVLVQIVLGTSLGPTVLVHLPGLTLPTWLAGLRLGGDVTAESLLPAVYDGLRLATILICIGAANSLASPTRLLKSVPAALYELGVSVVVALTFTPQLVADVDRLRATRRLRGRATSGLTAIAGAAVPVLEGALERSVTLAAAMDSRGYGRRGDTPTARRRMSAGLLLGGLVAAAIGAYGLVSADSPALLGLPMLAVGVLAATAGTVLAGRGSVRTRYRPDPWRAPEWLVALAGAFVATSLAAAAWSDVSGLQAPVSPPGWPSLPVVAIVAAIVAATPALTAPALPAGATAARVERRTPLQAAA